MEHEIPEIFQDLMNLLIETGKAEELEYFSNSIPCNFSISELCFMLGDIFMIVYEDEELSISFNTRTPPSLSADIIRFFMNNNYDLEVYESFYFFNGELTWESDEGKMDFNISLN